jgi:hypothetical protein
MKTCNRCNIEKELFEFNKNSSSKDGLRHYCRDCQKQMALNYSEKKGDELKEKKRLWKLNNPDKVKESYKKSYAKYGKIHSKKTSDRYKNDSIYRLKQLLRKRLRDILRSKQIHKKVHTLDILGCSPSYLKEHLEHQFKEGMNWDNQGKWHIDHIIPLSSGNTEEEIIKLCHYTNLQPLWAIDNMKKGSKTPF